MAIDFTMTEEQELLLSSIRELSTTNSRKNISARMTKKASIRVNS